MDNVKVNNKKFRLVFYLTISTIVFLVLNLCWWAGAHANNGRDQVNGFNEYYFEKTEDAVPSPNSTWVDGYGDGCYDVAIDDGKSFFTKSSKTCKGLYNKIDKDGKKHHQVFDFTPTASKGDIIHPYYKTRHWTDGREVATLENINIYSSHEKLDGSNIWSSTDGAKDYFFSDNGSYRIGGPEFFIQNDGRLLFKVEDFSNGGTIDAQWDRFISGHFYFKLKNFNNLSEINLHFYNDSLNIYHHYPTCIDKKPDVLELANSKDLDTFLHNTGFDNLYDGINKGSFKLELCSMILDTHGDKL